MTVIENSIAPESIETTLQQMTLEEFKDRIDKSMEDSKNGRLIAAGDLKTKIERWR